MEKNMLDLYGRASEWTLEKVQGAASKLGDDTPCDEWDVRTLMNHMLDTQNYFASTARGEKATLSPDPERLSDDPVVRPRPDDDDPHIQRAGCHRQDGPSLGIALADQPARLGLGEGDRAGHDDAEGPPRRPYDDPRPLHRRPAQGCSSPRCCAHGSAPQEKLLATRVGIRLISSQTNRLKPTRPPACGRVPCLRADALEVGLHRLVTDRELRRDLRVRQALGEIPQHLGLACGQRNDQG